MTMDKDPTLLPPPPPPIRHYRVDVEGGSWWKVAWLPSVGTFEAVHLVVDRHEVEQILAWHGTGTADVTSVDQLRSIVTVRIPDDVATALAADQGAHPLDDSPTANTDRGLSEREVRAWERELEAREARLAAREATIGPDVTEQRASLPAMPATEALRSLAGEPGFSTSDVEEFARGLGLDPFLTDQLLAGRIGDLDAQQIAQVCEALHCSPYDMWGPELGRTILHAYGPEHWPRHIEPLGERSLPVNGDDFIRRRLNARAAELAGPPAAVGRGLEPPATAAREGALALSRTVEATCFERTGVLAVDFARGTTVVNDPGAAPEPGVEYHFSFRQAGPTSQLDLEVTAEDMRDGPLPGFDVLPALAMAAEQLRGRNAAFEGIELVRFADQTTDAEQWIGWDSALGTWQSWDDPRRYYPGDPSDVLAIADGATAGRRFDPTGPSPPEFRLGCECVLADSGPRLDL